MDACILTNNYPNDNDYYKNAFVHRRIKNYQERDMKVEVFVYSERNTEQYNFDGVKVTIGNGEYFKRYMKKHSPKTLLVHFLDRKMIDTIFQLDKNYPTIVWIHGFEALGWYRRLFNINKKFCKYILSNTRQLWKLRQFIIQKENFKIVFVSKWMKKVTETDTLTKLNDWEVIPNVIDDKVFTYKKKDEGDTKNILVIRPFTSKKYATDIIVKSILELSKYADFNKFTINIFGDGPLFDKTLSPLKSFENVVLHKRFLSQEEIKQQHDNHGVFLCPTRQDAQGVSMCEAMASGLVAISSNNTAIPEFVEHNKTGILTEKSPKKIAEEIIRLDSNKADFLKISESGANFIRQYCSPDVVVNKEVDLIQSVYNE